MFVGENFDRRPSSLTDTCVPQQMMVELQGTMVLQCTGDSGKKEEEKHVSVQIQE